MIIIFEVDEWKSMLEPSRLEKRLKNWADKEEPKYVMVARTDDGEAFTPYTKELGEYEKLFREIKKWLIVEDIPFNMPYSLQIDFWNLADAMRTKLVWG